MKQEWNFPKDDLDISAVSFYICIVLIAIAVIFTFIGCTPQPLPKEKIVCTDGHYLDSKTRECEKIRF